MNTVTMIPCDEWDRVVVETYGRPYCFQQQDGCRDRGVFQLEPDEAEDYPRDMVQGDERGVRFSAWLARDPNEPVPGYEFLTLWWERRFYPDPDVLAADLRKRGLLSADVDQILVNW